MLFTLFVTGLFVVESVHPRGETEEVLIYLDAFKGHRDY